MSYRLTTQNCSVAMLPLLLAALLIQACGGGGNAIAQSATDADPVEGVWESTVTIRDCATAAPLRAFKGLSVLHRGGTASATNSNPPSSNGPAFGTWRATTAPATSTAAFRLFRFNADGSFAGAQNLTRTLKLESDGNTMTGTISAELLDPAMQLEGIGGGIASTPGGSRQDATLSVLRPEQREAYQAERQNRRDEAEKDLQAIGLSLPPTWDMLDDEDF